MLLLLNGAQQSDADVRVAAFQHCQLVAADRFDQPHLHVWKHFRETGQERWKYSLHDLRRGCDPERPRVSAAKKVRLFGQRCDVAQHRATIAKKLLAFLCEQHPASRAIKKFEADTSFEVDDLSRMCLAPRTLSLRQRTSCATIPTSLKVVRKLDQNGFIDRTYAAYGVT
jgi:hypothetical protein